MNATACEDRGADLFPVARGAEPSPDLAAHLASCGGCRADLERLRALAADLPAASAGIVPRPATRAAVLGATGASLPLPKAPPPPPPPRPPGPGRILRFWVPLAAAAAGLAAVAVVLSRPAGRTMVDARGGAVEVTPEWGGAVLEGVVPGGMRPGAEIAARGTASVRLGPPLDAEVVLGAGTRLRLAAGEAGRTVELLEGVAFFDPGPPGSGPAGGASLLRVRAGALEVEERGGHFTLERRAGGTTTLLVEAGVVVAEGGGRRVTASGPCRVDAAAGGAPGEPVPVEAGDATGWFAAPEVLLALEPGREPGARDLVVTLRPAVPRTLRVAAWSRLDPLFSIRASAEGSPDREIPIAPSMARRPPPEGDARGAFLLGPRSPYKIHLDPAALGLAPGAYRLAAVYAAHRPGGLWRGVRASNAVEIVIE
jgi:hypothetical protein